MDNDTFEPHGTHRIAGHFFKQSAEDYAAARCCLLNGLFPGFVMAEQAVEKLVKGLILSKDPAFKPKRGHGHDLGSLCARLQEKYPHIDLTDYAPVFTLLQSSYDVRYPDSPTDQIGRATSELRNIDELYMYLDSFIPIQGDMRFQIGALPLLYSAYVNLSNMPDGKWILHGNAAALRVLTGSPIPAIVSRWHQATLRQQAQEQSIADVLPLKP